MKIIATWKMPYESMQELQSKFTEDYTISQAIEDIIVCVEDYAAFHSVGYGGLPNKRGVVELDAAFMDGTTLNYGAIAAVKNIKNPIKVARSLLTRYCNNFLVAEGAEEYADENHFERRKMLTDDAWLYWQKKLHEPTILKAYDGHDTVCVLGMDYHKNMAVGVSTSGLFMKEPGRVGDSPIIGSGYYADSKVGAVAATGLGEDIMRGCLSIKVIEAMRFGVPVQEACEKVLKNHLDQLKTCRQQVGGISLIAMDRDGEIGAVTNEKTFPFVVLENQEVKLYYVDDNQVISEADEAWIKSYQGD